MDDCFIKISQLFGILPTKLHQSYKQLRIAQNTIIFLLWIALTYFLAENISNEEGSLTAINTGFNMLSTLTTSMRMFLIINTILRINIFQYDTFCGMQTLFKEIDELISYKRSSYNSEKTKIRLKNEFVELKAILVFGLFIILQGSESFVHEADIFHGFIYALANFYIFLTNTVNWSIMKDLSVRLDALNKFLKEFINNSKESQMIKVEFINCKQQKDQYDVHMWNRIHLHANKIVSYYNELFGWHMFVLTLFDMLMILTLLQEYLVSDKFEFNINYGNIVVYTLYQTLQMVVIVHRCDEVTNLSKQTTVLAYECANYCDASEKKEITRFAGQTGMQYAVCSAAGFFVIDNSLIFTMLQLITTYVIVLVQFAA